MHDEAVYAERSLKAGAKGYLMKHEPVREIISAIRRILSSGFYLSDEVNRRLLMKQTGQVEEKNGGSSLEDLSERELEVFRLIGRGMKPREIAQSLYLSPKTVESHRIRIRKKLGLKNASELTRFCVEWFQQK